MKKIALLIICCFLFSSIFAVKDVSAIPLPPCPPCFMCPNKDCQDAKKEIGEDHKQGRKDIIAWIGRSHGTPGIGGTGQFRKYEDWFFRFTIRHIIRAMMMMTEQLSAIGMQQMFALGVMMDGTNEMDMQRTIAVLQSEAHLDYQTSKDFCWFGTNVRSLAHAEQKGRMNMQALNARQLARHLGNAASPGTGVAGARDRTDDRRARWDQFVGEYCDPQDNNFTGNDTGLTKACGAAGGARVNNDIDFTRMVDYPRTIDINFDEEADMTDTEQDIMALSSNLYGHNVLTRILDESALKNDTVQHLYLTLRTIAAKRAVAEDSFNALVGMKAKSDAAAAGTTDYLAALMKELGMNNNDIFEIIDENPSYYAQLEILSKRIAQNPDFYAGLYDTPANVARRSTALRAIDIMVGRATFESQIRREMSLSVALSALLRDEFRAANAGLGAK